MKKVWVGIIVVLVLAFSGGIYFWQRDSNKQIPEISTNVTPTSTPEELLEWKDQAGFSFSYPKSLIIDIHKEDQENYAHIEFTHPDYSGNIIVWAKDLPAQAGTTDEWVKKTLAAGTVFDTTFANMDAKKILITSPKKKIITAVVDERIAFYVEGEFDQSDYWAKAYDTITSTFIFTVDESNVSQEALFDEEEILE